MKRWFGVVIFISACDKPAREPPDETAPQGSIENPAFPENGYALGYNSPFRCRQVDQLLAYFARNGIVLARDDDGRHSGEEFYVKVPECHVVVSISVFPEGSSAKETDAALLGYALPPDVNGVLALWTHNRRETIACRLIELFQKYKRLR